MSQPAEGIPPWLRPDTEPAARDGWQRSRRRLWIALPGVVVLAVAGLALLTLAAWAAVARGDFAAADYAAARDAFSTQHQMTQQFPEPWKGAFNEGTAALGEALASTGEFSDARVLLEEALDEVPVAQAEQNGGKPMDSPECRVRLNLSLTIEGQALAAAAADNKPDAVAFYDEAMDVIGPCSSDGDSEKDSSSDQQSDPQNDADSTEQRQLEGKEDQESAQEQEPEADSGEQSEQQQGESGEQDQGEGESEPTVDPNQMNEDDPRVEELQERNEEAQREAEEYQQGTGGGFGGGQNW